MSRGKVVLAGALVAVVALGFLGQALCQESRPRDFRGSRDPNEWRQRMEEWRQQASERMRENLGATPEEWKVLQPKIEKVQTLSMQSRGGMMFPMWAFGRSDRTGGDRPGGNRPGGDRPGGDRPREGDPRQSEVGKTMSALQQVVQKKDAKPEEVKAALTAYREARVKARTELEQAQKELKDIVTVRQEAQLVAMGVLD